MPGKNLLGRQMNEENVLLCGTTRTVESRSDTCSRCGVEVWRARSSPVEPAAICIGCLMAIVQADEDIVKIEAATTEQVRDIMTYLTYQLYLTYVKN